MAFRQRSVWLRAVKLGLTVGLLQATINQGDHWLRGEITRAVIIKSIVSPLIGTASGAASRDPGSPPRASPRVLRKADVSFS